MKHEKPSEEMLNEIYKVYKYQGLADIGRMFNIPQHYLRAVYYYCMLRRDEERNISMRFEPLKYWNTEDEIFEALEPNYSPDQLSGWELEQFNNL